MNDRDRSDISRRKLLKSMGAASSLAMTGTMLSVGKALAQDLYEVNMQLNWIPSNAQMGEIVADKLGFYADEGLKLNIMPGGPNVDGVASVASGRANLGSLSSSPSLMLARAAGIPLKCVAAGMQKHPFTYFSLAKNPVRTPADMVGKKIATNGTARILLEALLAANNLSEDDMEIMVSGGDQTVLLTGQADVVSGWATNAPGLAVLGDDRVDLSLWDSGIQLYAMPYYVTDETLAEHRDKIEAMMRVSARGWGWVHENQEEAVKILVERYPNMDLQIELDAVSLVDAHVFTEETRKHGWGTMNKENWKRQIETYDALGQFDGVVPKLEDMVDFSILEATAADRPKFG